MTTCVTQIDNDRIPGQLANPCPNEVVLFANACIGTVEATEESEIEKKVEPELYKPIIVSSKDLTEEECLKFILMLRKKTDLFAQHEFDLGKCNLLHHIILNDTIPIRLKTCIIMHTQQEEVNRQIKIMLEWGTAKPSKSPWCSPIVTVKKNGGATRICVDYRAINDISHGDSYPLPLIDDMFNKTRRATIFSSLDLKQATIKFKILKRPKQLQRFPQETDYTFRLNAFQTQWRSCYF